MNESKHETPSSEPLDYDGEAFYGIFTMLIHEYPDKSLGELWTMIDWPAIRLYGEGSLEYHERMDRLRESRRV